MTDQKIENNLQSIESAILDIAQSLNWFTPTEIKDVPNKPGFKRIAPSPSNLPDAKEHQMLMDKGLGFALANICYHDRNRLANVFLHAISNTGLFSENHEAFAEQVRQLMKTFPFEEDKSE